MKKLLLEHMSLPRNARAISIHRIESCHIPFYYKGKPIFDGQLIPVSDVKLGYITFDADNGLRVIKELIRSENTRGNLFSVNTDGLISFYDAITAEEVHSLNLNDLLSTTVYYSYIRDNSIAWSEECRIDFVFDIYKSLFSVKDIDPIIIHQTPARFSLKDYTDYSYYKVMSSSFKSAKLLNILDKPYPIEHPLEFSRNSGLIESFLQSNPGSTFMGESQGMRVFLGADGSKIYNPDYYSPDGVITLKFSADGKVFDSKTVDVLVTDRRSFFGSVDYIYSDEPLSLSVLDRSGFAESFKVDRLHDVVLSPDGYMVVTGGSPHIEYSLMIGSRTMHSGCVNVHNVSVRPKVSDRKIVLRRAYIALPKIKDIKIELYG